MRLSNSLLIAAQNNTYGTLQRVLFECLLLSMRESYPYMQLL